MNSSPRGSTRPLQAALLLGLAGDLLFRNTGFGLNVVLWVSAVLGGWRMIQKNAQPLTAREQLVLGLALGFAAIFVWRDASMLQLASLIGLVGCATLLPFAGNATSPVLLEIGEFFQALGGQLRRFLVGLVPPMLEARVAESKGKTSGALLATFRGLALALPTMVIFGSLLASADAGFKKLVQQLFHFNAQALLQHGFAVVGFGWLAAAVLVQPTASHDAIRALRRPGRLGAIETAIVLGLLGLTFLVFVILQAHWFFGGDALVRSTDGLTYATYARRGFFELVTVTALVLPLMLLFRSGLRAEDQPAHRVYRLTAGSLTALTLIIVGSALHRMAIYQREFGLTELRFYASAFIGGLAFTLLWFAATVLRERPARFLSGGLVSWTTWVAMLVLANPASLIAKVNIQRAVEGRDFDVSYAVSLGADAVPALVADLDRLPESYRFALTDALRGQWSGPGGRDWRGWSLADSRAHVAARPLAETASHTPVSP